MAGVICDNLTGHVLELHLKAIRTILERQDKSLLADLKDLVPLFLVGFLVLKTDLLSLYGNDFQGPIPNGLQNLTSLRHFDLSGNLFNSSIPDWLHILVSLSSFLLKVSFDFIPCGELEGSIPRSLGQTFILGRSRSSFNKLEGIYLKFTLSIHKIYAFDVSENSLSLKVSPDWIPPSNLECLVCVCHLGLDFHLASFAKEFIALDISNSTLVDTISKVKPMEYFEPDFFESLELIQQQPHGRIP
ncbi:receptor-like protein 52 [Pistacia vera]|uniref:receptor-like protein 52 n=1 Tax=Pistacia vera TaxID=55513 RepID=UPI0012637E33|nr:receptor-like protein 52 [Pistacia vera]